MENNREKELDPTEKKRLKEERDRLIDRIIDPIVTDHRHSEATRLENTPGVTFHQ
ncbi:hypothetical protein [Dyadobacter sp. 676]|uniref:Uncharacterized protein n=1 Tax=Dyadobacter sp. 676 TaxID=3088362 RepID=A0AAU8FT91_9BACT